jgi:threonine dehydratase
MSPFSKAINNITKAKFIKKTPLEFNTRLSQKYNCKIYLKREDQQLVRSFKIRGAYNKVIRFQNEKSLTTASAGNHAQGFAYVCSKIKKPHNIFIPKTTPKQKIEKIEYFGTEYLNLNIVGDNFNECLSEALQFSKHNKSPFVHPFDDMDVILGQSTIAKEIIDDIESLHTNENTIDYLISPIGGGGLISGLSMYFNEYSKNTKIIGAEPENADSMNQSINNKKITSIKNLDTFVDGASVKTVGNLTYDIGKKYIDDIFVINNNHLCFNLIQMYQKDGIIIEPAGVLSICVLDKMKEQIKGKTVVCLISGGNNDILRYNEFLEKSLLYQNLKHYFIIEFNKKPNQLRYFVNNILLQDIDITRFEYLKKTNRDLGSVLIGLELKDISQLHLFIKNLEINNYKFIKLNDTDILYNYLV